MININDLKNEVDLLARKHATGATFTPAMFTIAAQGALRDFVRKYVGLPENYQAANPASPIAYEITNLVNDYLSPFKATDVPLIINNSGVAPKPVDYYYRSVVKLKKVVNTEQEKLFQTMDSCTCGCGKLVGQCPKSYTTTETKYVEVPVEIVDDMQFTNRLNSSGNRKPTMDYPICKFEKDRIQFAPFNLKTAYITYLQDVNIGKPVWGFIPFSVPPVYDPLTSVNVKLPSICQTEMSVLILARLGISIREEALMGYAQGVKAQGT